MNSKKMICLDIDGTLLNSENNLTTATKKVVCQLAEQGHIIVLVSARMSKSIYQIIRNELQLNLPFISYNGAMICSKGSITNHLLNKTINLNIAKEILKLSKKKNVSINLYKGEKWFVEKIDRNIESEKLIVKVNPEVVKFRNLFNTWEPLESEPNKIMIIGDKDKIEQLEQDLSNSYRNEVNIVRSKPTYLEIIEKSCSKTKAIKILKKHFEINQSQIVAIGDNYNDMDMIKFANYGIAMGNSPEDVKMIANHVTLSNDNDGVAEALSKFLV